MPGPYRSLSRPFVSFGRGRGTELQENDIDLPHGNEVRMKVREVVRMLEGDGWHQVAQRGSHRQFRHPTKPGRVTVAGSPGHDLAAGTLANILRQARLSKGDR